MNNVNLGRYLSYILRHNPSDIDLELQEYGFVDVNMLIDGINKHYNESVLTMERLEQIVAEDNKQRYSFNDDKTMIRANQGHSIHVDLGLIPVKPPEILYHGTADKFLNKILLTGIKKMTRDFVHLSADISTAVNVGSRHGNPVVLSINAKQMYNDGIKFYQADNGVWLTDNIAPRYCSVYTKDINNKKNISIEEREHE